MRSSIIVAQPVIVQHRRIWPDSSRHMERPIYKPELALHLRHRGTYWGLHQGTHRRRLGLWLHPQMPEWIERVLCQHLIHLISVI